MTRLLAAIITFSLGVALVNLTTTLLSFRVDSVPAVSDVSLSMRRIADIDDAEPKYVAFFDSFGDSHGFGGWLIADKFKGMEEVWTVMLSGKRNDQDRFGWTAMVLTSNADGTSNDDDSFVSAKLTAEHDRLIFSTVTIRGIQYKFDGRFLYGGSTFSDDEVVLRGTMQKIKNGKVVAKFTSDFTYSEPRCFH